MELELGVRENIRLRKERLGIAARARRLLERLPERGHFRGRRPGARADDDQGGLRTVNKLLHNNAQRL
eukprot:3370415-Lingulodinium_polyedra.AAC.1